MEGKAEDVSAEIIPVALRVAKVEMPCLIDGIGRCDGVPGGGAEVEEFPILRDDSGAVGGAPAIFPREPV